MRMIVASPYLALMDSEEIIHLIDTPSKRRIKFFNPAFQNNSVHHIVAHNKRSSWCELIHEFPFEIIVEVDDDDVIYVEVYVSSESSDQAKLYGVVCIPLANLSADGQRFLIRTIWVGIKEGIQFEPNQFEEAVELGLELCHPKIGVSVRCDDVSALPASEQQFVASLAGYEDLLAALFEDAAVMIGGLNKLVREHKKNSVETNKTIKGLQKELSEERANMRSQVDSLQRDLNRKNDSKDQQILLLESKVTDLSSQMQRVEMAHRADKRRFGEASLELDNLKRQLNIFSPSDVQQPFVIHNQQSKDLSSARRRLPSISAVSGRCTSHGQGGVLGKNVPTNKKKRGNSVASNIIINAGISDSIQVVLKEAIECQNEKHSADDYPIGSSEVLPETLVMKSDFSNNDPGAIMLPACEFSSNCDIVMNDNSSPMQFIKKDTTADQFNYIILPGSDDNMDDYQNSQTKSPVSRIPRRVGNINNFKMMNVCNSPNPSSSIPLIPSKNQISIAHIHEHSLHVSSSPLNKDLNTSSTHHSASRTIRQRKEVDKHVARIQASRIPKKEIVEGVFGPNNAKSFNQIQNFFSLNESVNLSISSPRPLNNSPAAPFLSGIGMFKNRPASTQVRRASASIPSRPSSQPITKISNANRYLSASVPPPNHYSQHYHNNSMHNNNDRNYQNFNSYNNNHNNSKFQVSSNSGVAMTSIATKRAAELAEQVERHHINITKNNNNSNNCNLSSKLSSEDLNFASGYCQQSSSPRMLFHAPPISHFSTDQPFLYEGGQAQAHYNNFNNNNSNNTIDGVNNNNARMVIDHRNHHQQQQQNTTSLSQQFDEHNNFNTNYSGMWDFQPQQRRLEATNPLTVYNLDNTLVSINNKIDFRRNDTNNVSPLSLQQSYNSENHLPPINMSSTTSTNNNQQNNIINDNCLTSPRILDNFNNPVTSQQVLKQQVIEQTYLKKTDKRDIIYFQRDGEDNDSMVPSEFLQSCARDFNNTIFMNQQPLHDLTSSSLLMMNTARSDSFEIKNQTCAPSSSLQNNETNVSSKIPPSQKANEANCALPPSNNNYNNSMANVSNAQNRTLRRIALLSSPQTAPLAQPPSPGQPPDHHGFESSTRIPFVLCSGSVEASHSQDLNNSNNITNNSNNHSHSQQQQHQQQVSVTSLQVSSELCPLGSLYQPSPSSPVTKRPPTVNAAASNSKASRALPLEPINLSDLSGNGSQIITRMLEMSSSGGHKKNSLSPSIRASPILLPSKTNFVLIASPVHDSVNTLISNSQVDEHILLVSGNNNDLFTNKTNDDEVIQKSPEPFNNNLIDDFNGSKIEQKLLPPFFDKNDNNMCDGTFESTTKNMQPPLPRPARIVSPLVQPVIANVVVATPILKNGHLSNPLLNLQETTQELQNNPASKSLRSHDVKASNDNDAESIKKIIGDYEIQKDDDKENIIKDRERDDEKNNTIINIESEQTKLKNESDSVNIAKRSSDSTSSKQETLNQIVATRSSAATAETPTPTPNPSAEFEVFLEPPSIITAASLPPFVPDLIEAFVPHNLDVNDNHNGVDNALPSTLICSAPPLPNALCRSPEARTRIPPSNSSNLRVNLNRDGLIVSVPFPFKSQSPSDYNNQTHFSSLREDATVNGGSSNDPHANRRNSAVSSSGGVHNKGNNNTNLLDSSTGSNSVPSSQRHAQSLVSSIFGNIPFTNSSAEYSARTTTSVQQQQLHQMQKATSRDNTGVWQQQPTSIGRHVIAAGKFTTKAQSSSLASANHTNNKSAPSTNRTVLVKNPDDLSSQHDTVDKIKNNKFCIPPKITSTSTSLSAMKPIDFVEPKQQNKNYHLNFSSSPGTITALKSSQHHHQQENPLLYQLPFQQPYGSQMLGPFPTMGTPLSTVLIPHQHQPIMMNGLYPITGPLNSMLPYIQHDSGNTIHGMSALHHHSGTTFGTKLQRATSGPAYMASTPAM